MVTVWTAVWPAENLYEEVQPVALLDTRVSDAGRDFMVKFPDAEEDCWVCHTAANLPAVCHLPYCHRLSQTYSQLINAVFLPV